MPSVYVPRVYIFYAPFGLNCNAGQDFVPVLKFLPGFLWVAVVTSAAAQACMARQANAHSSLYKSKKKSSCLACPGESDTLNCNHGLRKM